MDTKQSFRQNYKIVLGGGFIVLSLSAIIGGSLLVFFGARIQEEIHQVQNRYVQNVQNFGRIETDMNLLRIYIRDEIYSIPSKYQRTARAKIDSVVKSIDIALNKYEPLFYEPGEESNYKNYVAAFNDYRKILYQILAISESGDKPGAQKMLTEKLIIYRNRIERESANLIRENEQVASTIDQRVKAQQVKFIWISALILTASFLIGILIYFYTLNTLQIYLAGIAKSQQENVQLLDLLTDRQKRIENLMIDLEMSTEEQRKRFSQELHDAIGHNLTAAIFNIESARTVLIPSQSQALNFLDNALENTKESLAEAKRISYELRPSLLDDFGLAKALKQLSRDFEKRTGVHLIAELDEKTPRLDAQKEISIFRVVQETFTNIEKHAGAKTVTLQVINRDDGKIALSVIDDGVGFETANVDSNDTPHFGLRNIVDRVGRMGGTVIIDSVPGRGTEINIEIAIS
ncbi:MAG: MCP four helix bundle domain-containing protein [Bacteroidota bacterium]